MKIRFVAKQIGKTWGVYDTHRGSWPTLSPDRGPVRQGFSTELEAQVEADRLNNT